MVRGRGGVDSYRSAWRGLLWHPGPITQPEGVDVDRPTVGSVQILRGNALALALADESVDLIVTSPRL